MQVRARVVLGLLLALFTSTSFAGTWWIASSDPTSPHTLLASKCSGSTYANGTGSNGYGTYYKFYRYCIPSGTHYANKYQDPGPVCTIEGQVWQSNNTCVCPEGTELNQEGTACVAVSTIDCSQVPALAAPTGDSNGCYQVTDSQGNSGLCAYNSVVTISPEGYTGPGILESSGGTCTTQSDQTDVYTFNDSTPNPEWLKSHDGKTDVYEKSTLPTNSICTPNADGTTQTCTKVDTEITTNTSGKGVTLQQDANGNWEITDSGGTTNTTTKTSTETFKEPLGGDGSSGAGSPGSSSTTSTTTTNQTNPSQFVEVTPNGQITKTPIAGTDPATVSSDSTTTTYNEDGSVNTNEKDADAINAEQQNIASELYNGAADLASGALDSMNEFLSGIGNSTVKGFEEIGASPTVPGPGSCTCRPFTFSFFGTSHTVGEYCQSWDETVRPFAEYALYLITLISVVRIFTQATERG